MTVIQQFGAALTAAFGGLAFLSFWAYNAVEMENRYEEGEPQPRFAWLILLSPLFIGLGLILFGG